MDTAKRPVRTTIFFGLICALIFVGLGIFFEHTVFWSVFFRMTIFGILAAYSLILTSWSGQNRISIIFPLLFLVVFNFAHNSNYAFLLLCLGMLSWIRSGICFQNAFSKSLGAEIIFSIGGGALVVHLNPYSTVTWAIGIWMFFLVQSMYFIVMTDAKPDKTHINADAFEEARMRAENILNLN
jgi:hypothetical protein